jgi:hypothetical protein
MDTEMDQRGVFIPDDDPNVVDRRRAILAALGLKEGERLKATHDTLRSVAALSLAYVMVLGALPNQAAFSALSKVRRDLAWIQRNRGGNG